MHRLRILLLVGTLALWAQLGAAQNRVTNNIPNPDSKYLFTQDSALEKKATKKEIATILGGDSAPKNEVEFKAPQVEFDKEASVVHGSQGVLVSGLGVRAEADQGTLAIESNQLSLKGQSVISDSQGSISSDQADYNIEDETGVFKNAHFALEENGYRVTSEQAEKLSDTKYRLFNSWFTTCNCDDKSVPWRFSSEECRITQEGYAHSYGTTLELFGIPVFYTPYLGFPAKTERASGMLAPTLGLSDKHGFVAEIPVFLVLDDSSDATVAPFVETKTRNGAKLDFREVFSKYSKLASRFIYSNERPRNGDLQGTNTDGLYDPTFDQDRTGLRLNQQWSSDPDSPMRLGFVTDIQYVSDDLLLREIDGNEIGDRQSPYTASRVVGRAGIGDFGSAEIGADFTQSLTSDDNLTYQRYPEGLVTMQRSLRPFGSNPYGFKIVAGTAASAVRFTRDIGYDGWRSRVVPFVAVPFHYENYFYSQAQVRFDQTWYRLSDTANPNGGADLPSDSSHSIPVFTYAMSTALERVSEVPADSSLKWLAALGERSQGQQLVRVKHVIEPLVGFTHVPKVDQEDNPLFDQSDRIRDKDLVFMGLSTSLLGRFNPRSGSEEVVELMPRVEDLPPIQVDRALDDLSTLDNSGAFGIASPRRGQIRELMTFSVKQTYDYQLAQDNDSSTRPWSDLGGVLGLYPNRNFSIYFDSNYNRYNHQLSSWGISTSVRDDRGDALRARATYVRGSISQLESNVEVAISSRLKAGYYTRYDDIDSEFIENYAALRLTSACDCWHFDVGMRETVNPDKQAFYVSFNLGGLGDVSQNLLVNRPQQTP